MKIWAYFAVATSAFHLQSEPGLNAISQSSSPIAKARAVRSGSGSSSESSSSSGSDSGSGKPKPPTPKTPKGKSPKTPKSAKTPKGKTPKGKSPKTKTPKGSKSPKTPKSPKSPHSPHSSHSPHSPDSPHSSESPAHPPCYDCNNPCNDCDGGENNIVNINFAPINTNQQNWININTEIETDVNVNTGMHHQKPDYGYEKPQKPSKPESPEMPKFDFDGLLDWLEEEINDCEDEDKEKEEDELPPSDDYMDPTTLAPDSNDTNDLRIEITKRIDEADCIRKSKNGDKLSMHYSGYFLDGTSFDSSYNRGKPFAFTLGAGEVIKGWDQGLNDMCIGEQRKLTIPSDLAYGDAGIGDRIPGGATLMFDVELVDIIDMCIGEQRKLTIP